MASVPVIDVSAGRIDVGWDQGDPVAIGFTAVGVVSEGWGTTYQAQVRRTPTSSGVFLASFAVAATVVGDDIQLLLTMSSADSANVPIGIWWWDLQEVGGPTRLKGRARVGWTVTA